MQSSSNSSTKQNLVRTNILTDIQKDTAKEIYNHLKKESTQSILLHCHPNPDPDSLGSTLAMKFALESIGKKVTLIAGDSKTPTAFMHFPGASQIIPKNYFEIDIAEFDTFIILDSGSPTMISRKELVIFPPEKNPNLKTIVIDHHASNTGFADINIVATQYVSTTEVLFDLFQEWSIPLTSEVATNLYVGLFTDGGGFRYDRITDHSFYMAGVLYSYNPDMLRVVEMLENNNSSKSVDFLALSLTQKKVFNVGNNTASKVDKGSFVISYITHEDIVRLGLTPDDYAGNSLAAQVCRAVTGWNVVATLIETKPGEVKCSFRTRDQIEFDVSKVALVLGGGGHKAASGATILKPIDETIDEVSKAIREILFN